MEIDKTATKILKILLKDIAVHTITSLAKETGMSRVGIWKVLKKLEKESIIFLSQVGKGKTSTYIVKLNWDSPVIEKKLSLILTEDATKQERWINNFTNLENKVNFIILYGSILNFPKEANDIDIICVTNKKNLGNINDIIFKIQQTQIKKIHAINFTPEEFKKELEKPNRAFIDAVKKGIIIFGQDNFIKFIRGFQK